MKEDKDEKNSSSKKKKKPYQKPEIISEKIFDSSALSCAKCEDPWGPAGYCFWGVSAS